jgi:hypothetical protein
MRFVRSYFSEKRPETSAPALQRIPMAELSKVHHLRDFWRRTIVDFFNSIGAKRPFLSMPP